MEKNTFKFFLGISRLSIGLIFLWAFFDKLLGLGFATKAADSWLAGGSPTTGFLKFAVHGPFADFYHSIAGNIIVDYIFMLGLLFVGISLTLGIFVKLGGWSGIAMLFLMYTAIGIFPENNPFIDEHLVYIFLIMLLILGDSGKYIGLGNMWSETSLVKKINLFK